MPNSIGRNRDLIFFFRSLLHLASFSFISGQWRRN
jgi:hypothetical protein